MQAIMSIRSVQTVEIMTDVSGFPYSSTNDQQFGHLAMLSDRVIDQMSEKVRSISQLANYTHYNWLIIELADGRYPIKTNC
jgi:hypothetical protein